MNSAYIYKGTQENISNNVLTSLITYNISGTDVWMEVISGIKCKIDHLYLEEGSINYFDTRTIPDIYV